MSSLLKKSFFITILALISLVPTIFAMPYSDSVSSRTVVSSNQQIAARWNRGYRTGYPYRYRYYRYPPVHRTYNYYYRYPVYRNYYPNPYYSPRYYQYDNDIYFPLYTTPQAGVYFQFS